MYAVVSKKYNGSPLYIAGQISANSMSRKPKTGKIFAELSIRRLIRTLALNLGNEAGACAHVSMPTAEPTAMVMTEDFPPTAYRSSNVLRKCEAMIERPT